MASAKKPPSPRAASTPSLVWERSEPPRRRAPVHLSRESIVDTAILIADGDGLSAVSLRNVAAALAAGPMRLYGYVDTKEELFDLMVDEVQGEILRAVKGTTPRQARRDGGPPDEGSAVSGIWREVMTRLANATRAAALAHPWLVELLGGRQRIGPNALARLEMALAAFREVPGFEDIDAVVQAVGTVDAYVAGAVQSEVNEARAERESGLDEPAWHGATWPYLQRLIATGNFPMIARVVRDARHPSAEVAFARGLAFVLDGVAASVTRDSKR